MSFSRETVPEQWNGVLPRKRLVIRTANSVAPLKELISVLLEYDKVQTYLKQRGL